MVMSLWPHFGLLCNLAPTSNTGAQLIRLGSAANDCTLVLLRLACMLSRNSIPVGRHVYDSSVTNLEVPVCGESSETCDRNIRTTAIPVATVA